MMEFEKHEEEIKEMLKPLKNEKPPSGILKDYEKQVMAKIHDAESGPSFGFMPVLALGLVLGGALVYWIAQQPEPAKDLTPQPVIEAEAPAVLTKAPSMPTPVPAPVVEKVVKELQQTIPVEESLLDSLADDLFILEMLGEDEGLLDDLERMETDMEFWSQSPAPIAGI